MASKRKNTPAPNNGIINVGIDVGYGWTKAIGHDAPVIFPSVAGYARDLGFQRNEITQKYPGDQMVDEDGEWFVGRLAQRQLLTGEQLMLRGRTGNEGEHGNVFRLRMVKAALGKMFPGYHNGEVIHVRIATGLPVDHMGDAADLKASLIGQHRIKTDQTDIIANVTEVMVMPQPYGTVYRQMITDAGEDNPCYIHDMTGVVDVGTYTVDAALDDTGEYIGARSGSREAGVHLAKQHIATEYENRYRAKPTDDQLDEILKTGCFKAAGKPVTFTDVRDAAVERVRAATLNLLNEKWQTGVDIDVIFVAGGGADLVFNAIKAVYSQAELVEDAQLSNAQGYLNYARSTLLD